MITRRLSKCDASPGSPVCQHVPQRLIEFILWRPSRRLTQLANVRPAHRRVGLTIRIRLIVDHELDTCPCREAIEDVAYSVSLAGAGVIDFTRLTNFHQADVRPDHVADVGEVAAAVQIALDHDVRLRSAFDGHDLPCEVRDGVVRRLARPNLIERANAHDVERKIAAQLLGGGLACRVGRGRSRRIGFREDVLAGPGVTVDQAARNIQDARPQVCLRDRGVKAPRRVAVAGPGCLRFLKRPTVVRIAGEMEDPGGLNLLEEGRGGRRVVQIQRVSWDVGCGVPASPTAS